MRLRAKTEIDLPEPGVDAGLVTWLDFDVVEDLPDDTLQVVAIGRAASIHVGEAANVGAPLADVLDADSAELEALHEIYFEGDWLKDDYADGAGSGLLYIDEISVEPEWRDRGVEIAAVRRLCDTFGQGAALAVIAVPEDGQAVPWIRMGFEITRRADEGRWAYLHLRLGVRTPCVIEGEDGRFHAVPDPNPAEKRRQH